MIVLLTKFFFIILFYFILFFSVKERPDLESQFEERVQEAIKYARTINDFDELVDPRTLACHCLGLERSLYVLQTIDREQRKRESSSFLRSSILLYFLFGFLNFSSLLVQRW